jgi:hypothetical protein
MTFYDLRRELIRHMDGNFCFEPLLWASSYTIRCWIRLSKSKSHWGRRLCSSCRREIEEMAGVKDTSEIDMRTTIANEIIEGIQIRFFGFGRTNKSHAEDPIGW